MRDVGEMGSVPIDAGRRLLKNIVLQHRAERCSGTSKRSRETEAEQLPSWFATPSALRQAQDDIQFNYTTLMPSS
jgi:hypothetical protein